ncbi:MAG: flagellar biosynthesis anti-sigma factor FlgM [Defluviitaleaceae bacterium]|nr:flagellar biosynthesis anti-sigma factor FlgM [Defluviitaleaceae bacterium]
MDMRISSVYNAYSVLPSRGATPGDVRAERRETADKVSISAQAGDYQAARNAVAALPDVRADIVGRIQEMLDAGTYHVPAQDVAASIMGTW